MSTHDVRSIDPTPITTIMWCDNEGYNLVKGTTIHEGVTIDPVGLSDMHKCNVAMITDAEEGRNLILAIKKAIDLGWLS